jgi:hypothetical protein
MAIAFVRSSIDFGTGVSGTVTNVITGFNNTVGNLIVVGVHWEDFNVTISTMADTAGNVYTRLGRVAHATQLMYTELWYCLSCKTQTNNAVTATFSGTCDFRGISCLEFSYSGTAAFDNTNSGQVTAGTTLTVTPTPTSSGSNLIFLPISSWLSATDTNTVGAYVDLADVNAGHQTFYKIVTGTSGVTSTFTFATDEQIANYAIFNEVVAVTTILMGQACLV